jgi:hypothetical protein
MQHHGASPLSYSSNGAFGHAILMVCANTRVGEFLTLVRAILYKMLRSKGGIVGVVFPNRDAMFASPAFEFMLGF